jgi:hypothetical protein
MGMDPVLVGTSLLWLLRGAQEEPHVEEGIDALLKELCLHRS